MPLARDLADATVVITGASGGVGAATAVRLARRGAAVVLAARRPEALAEVAARCREVGGRALAVPTDVTDAAAVEALAGRAVAAFGHLDGWVNNAAVAAYGTFVDSDPAEFRRVIDTTLFGTAHGCRTAVPHLRRAGGGVIVNVASVLAEIAMPYLSGYNTAKHAVRGLSDTLRQELLADGERSISVCTILPASLDTPFFRHAANHTGRTVGPPPPAYPAGIAARAIVRSLEHPRRERYVGGAARVLGWQWRLSPALGEKVLGRYAARAEFRSSPAPPSGGNLFVPGRDPSDVDGGWGHRATTAARVAAFVAAGASLAAGLRVAAGMRTRPRA